MTPVLVLVGPPGAGKSTVGRLVASRREIGFRDTDDDVERAAGATIAEIFVDSGEQTFRELESEAVRVALQEHDGVLALGGGAVMDERTRDLLVGQCVVFLDVSLTDATSRVGLNRDRPLLLGNPRAALRTMLEQRRPVYDEVASTTVSTDGLTPEQVADAVEAVL